jgi:hypothetical protein
MSSRHADLPDILNKHVATSDPASQASVHASMELLLEVFPSMRNTTTAAPTTPWDRVKGNKRRVDAILPVMHKILVRHRKLDYRALLTRCLERLVRYPTVSIANLIRKT